MPLSGYGKPYTFKAPPVDPNPGFSMTAAQQKAILDLGIGAMLDRFQRIVGRRSDEDVHQAPGSVTSLRVVLTSRHALEKTLRELGLDHLFGVIITRMTRADLEMSTVQDLRSASGTGPN